MLSSVSSSRRRRQVRGVKVMVNGQEVHRSRTGTPWHDYCTFQTQKMYQVHCLLHAMFVCYRYPDLKYYLIKRRLGKKLVTQNDVDC